MGVFASVFFLFREAVLQENLLEDARVRGRLDTGHWDTGAVIWLDIRPAQRSYRMILSNLFRMVRHGSSPRVVMNLNHSKYERTYHTILSLCPPRQQILVGRLHSFRTSGFITFFAFHVSFSESLQHAESTPETHAISPYFFQRTFFSECLLLKNNWRPQASKCKFGRRQSGVDTPRQAPCKGAAGKSRKIGSRERRWACYLKMNRFFLIAMLKDGKDGYHPYR